MIIHARTRARIAALTAALLSAPAALLAAPAPAYAAAATVVSCPGPHTVFTAGDDGYHTYRIPALIKAADGTLIALAEGRRAGAADTGDIEVVERRSDDGGCTWGPLIRVADDWHETVGNPVVTMDAATGRLVLITSWQPGLATEAEITAGTDPTAVRRVYVQTSDDQGATWTPRAEITSQVKDPSWTWWSTGGHGVTLTRNADHPGRLVVPINYGDSSGMSGAGIIYSDDHGGSWHIGATDDHIDGVLAPNENSLAELNDGRIYLNARDNGGSDPATRVFTYSLHGGGFFSAPFRPRPDLIAPEIRGALLQDPGLPTGVSCAPLIFTAPDDPTARQHLALRRSGNGGWNWTTTTVIAPGLAGYTDLTKIDRTRLGVLYETGETTYRDRIEFQQITLTCPNP